MDCTAASMMISAKPLVFHRMNRAIEGLAQLVVVSQPTAGSPKKRRIALSTPKFLSKIRMNAWAIAASGVTYGTITIVRSDVVNRSLALVSRLAAATASTVWIGTMSTHITPELPSEDQNCGLVSR